MAKNDTTTVDKEIDDLLTKITTLEEMLEQKCDEKRRQHLYKLEGRKAIFDDAVKQQHARQRIGVFAYMRKLSFKTHLTGPVVYAMVIPFAFMDLCVSIYQKICFWAWEIPTVKRSEYVFIDRHHLSYLNGAEKLYCIFCGYANGVTAFTREVSARTEKYWCPIKHASKIKQAHIHYRDFIDYGDADSWRNKDH